MSDDEQKEFERRARALFDREVTDIDAATRSKLNQARQRALAELHRPAWALPGMPLPQAAAGAVAVAAISAFFVFRTDVSVVEPDLDFATASDIEILLVDNQVTDQSSVGVDSGTNDQSARLRLREIDMNVDELVGSHQR